MVGSLPHLAGPRIPQNEPIFEPLLQPSLASDEFHFNVDMSFSENLLYDSAPVMQQRECLCSTFKQKARADGRVLDQGSYPFPHAGQHL